MQEGLAGLGTIVWLFGVLIVIHLPPVSGYCRGWIGRTYPHKLCITHWKTW